MRPCSRASNRSDGWVPVVDNGIKPTFQMLPRLIDGQSG